MDHPLLRALFSVLLLAFVAGCAIGPDPDDPFEPTNRAVHDFNKEIDRVIIDPTAQAYGTVVPSPVRAGVRNAAGNLRLPGQFVNHVLQGDVQDAGETFFRFAMNTVFGLGGLLDPAGEAGLFERDTDFGQTMAVWGVVSGPYLEVPFYGPSTVRDASGAVVDLFLLDPVFGALDQTGQIAYIGLIGTDLIGQRHDFDAVIDALFYESTDSYLAARIAYLQNRQAERNRGQAASEDVEDPYAIFD